MERIKISVIIPVYNVAEFLRKCVYSVQKQSVKEIEIVLVDDGSTDGSECICDELASTDERIRVIHKQNGGLSSARNAGTAIAVGEYITYVDSDDWVAPELLQTLLHEVIRTGADIAVCDLLPTSNEDVRFPSSEQRPQQYSGPSAMELMLYQRSFDTSACGKLYRADLIKQFSFPEGRLYEDLFTIYKVMFTAKKIVHIPQLLYAYRKNPNSIMNQSFNVRMFDELDAADEIERFVEINAAQYLSAAKARKFSSYSQVLRWTKDADVRDKAICDKQTVIWRFLRGYRIQMLLDRKARIKNRLAALCTFLGEKVYINI